MLSGICPCMSCIPKFWHMYLITYSNSMVIVKSNIHLQQKSLQIMRLSSPQNYWRQKANAAEIAFQLKIIGGKNLPSRLFSLKYNNKKKL